MWIVSTVDRVRVPWSGGRGGPGISTFYANDGPAAVVAVHDFFNAMKSYVAGSITWAFPGEGDTVSVQTGELSGTWSDVPQLGVAATGADTHSADASGLLVRWNTGNVVYGHRVTGRTFFVPAIIDAFANGALNDTVITQVEGYAQDMIDASAGNFVVWTRPLAATPEWTDVHGRVHPAKTGHAGVTSQITTATVPDKGVVLRSRRD